MPIYEYACKSCGANMEIRQKFSDDPLTDCPECGAPTLERLVSASSFSLKGSGWYADGYGGPKPESKSSADAKESSNKDSGNKDSSSKDKKPDSGSKDSTKSSTETKKAS